jgi:hypothetical protein
MEGGEKRGVHVISMTTTKERRDKHNCTALLCEMDRRPGWPSRPFCWARITFPSRRSDGFFRDTGQPGNATVQYHRDQAHQWFCRRQSPFPGRVSFALGR